MLKRVAVFTGGLIRAEDKHLNILKAAAPDTEICIVKDVDELRQWSDNVDAVFTLPHDLQRLAEYCRTAKDFRWLQLLTAGCDALTGTDFMNMEKVLITSTHGIHADPIGDHVIAFIFAFLRGLLTAFENKASHRFYPPDMTVTGTLDEQKGKTVGIVSCGSIGVGIAEKLSRMGFRILGYSRHLKNAPFFSAFYTPGHLEEMLAECDFVVVTSPLTDETYHLFSTDQFNSMKKNAVFINVGRGPVCDSDALISALDSHRIAGAALDVTDPEPLPPDSRLWEMKNVIITWHCAAISGYLTDRAIAKIAENIALYNSGKEIPYIFKKPDA